MVAAVLLAAGGGSRFAGDTHKLLADLRGRPVLSHAIDAVVASGLDVYVVTGSVEIGHLLPPTVTVVHNPHWRDGQAVSARAGIAVADASGHDAVVVGLADQPFVTADAWRAVAATDAAVAVATYDGRRGHPVKLSSSVWSLLPPSGDEVGRAIMAGRPALVTEIRCEGDPADIDTLEDLRRWI
ncbi:MAG: nucleotidyltransferase family protein [Acidimicrobiales bacterium]